MQLKSHMSCILQFNTGIMFGKISLLLIFVVFQFIRSISALNTSSCDDLANCLNDLSDYVSKCGKELKDFFDSLPKNSSNEACTKAGNSFIQFGNLQAQRAKQVGDCVATAVGTDPKKCPKMEVTSSRKKRESDTSKWLKTANKVNTQCSNGGQIVDDVTAKLKKSEFLTRQQIVTAVKEQCKGTTNISVEDMPVLGGDIRLEISINKVLKECKNGADIVKNAKNKIVNKEFITRTEIVDYVKKECQGTTTLDVNDLPNYYDAKLETAITKVQKECKNSKVILADVSKKYENKTLFSRQQVVDYVSKQCDGRSTLKASDLPAFYGEDSTPFGKKLESVILKVQKECKNSDDILYQVKKQHDNGQMKSGDEIVKYVKSKCEGTSTLVIDDIPFRDCSSEKVKNSTQACLKLADGCSKAKYCNDCYEISPLHDAIHRTTLDLADAQGKCPSSNKKTATIS